MKSKSIFKNYFAIIPATVRYDKDLTANAKLLYGEITALCGEKGYCWATNSYFAELYGVSKKTISNWINQLSSKNYLQTYIKYREGSKEIEERRLYLGDVHTEEDFHTYGKKVHRGTEEDFHTPTEKNVKDNNTYINNTINNSMYVYKENCQEENILSSFKNLYEKNIGTINGITAEYLIDLSETIDVALFKKAIEIATDRGSCNLGYIKGIIRQWLSSNITTLEQLDAHLLQQNQKNKSSNFRTKRGSDNGEFRECAKQLAETTTSQISDEDAEKLAEELGIDI